VYGNMNLFLMYPFVKLGLTRVTKRKKKSPTLPQNRIITNRAK